MSPLGILVMLIIIICIVKGAIKVYVMFYHPDLYGKWQRAEQEKKLMEEQRKAMRDARIGNALKIGWWLGNNLWGR